ncbi:hypothetical protein PspLS_08689 [Pyricularia sp. CBS 133598]|nr:hypothetical protein PspLS_08689 [Pyricularia sp. CBS 133598]
MTQRLFNALIRTHHITSRKKIQRLRKAATEHSVNYVLIRSGGAPGIMYAEAVEEESVREWVDAVQALRYKDFRCVFKPAPAVAENLSQAGFQEVGAVSEFAKEMERRGLGSWWRRGMGYESAE